MYTYIHLCIRVCVGVGVGGCGWVGVCGAVPGASIGWVSGSVCLCVVCVYHTHTHTQVSDGSVGTWPTLQGGGWKNSQTAALRLLLCFAMGLEFVGGIDVEPALMGTHSQKLCVCVYIYRVRGRHRRGARAHGHTFLKSTPW